MSGSWRDIIKIIGAILALSLTVYNLYAGTDIFLALFRGVAAFLAFTIVTTLFTTVIYKVVNEFEFKRLQDMNQLEDSLAFDDDDEDEDDLARPSIAEDRAE
jgi:hypothetical protein